MRISAIELQYVGVFENQRLDFPICPDDKAEIHIFTGVNGSGKSTLLKALVCGFDYCKDTNQNECPKRTNRFTKYLRYYDDDSKIKKCKGSVEIHQKLNEGILQEINKIKFWGCSANGRKPHLHIPTKDKLILEYRRFLNSDDKKRPKYLFDFALFSYSGYRFIDYSNDTTPNYSFKNYNQNPLYQSLEFIKDPNPAYTIDNWVMTNLLKRSYAREHRLNDKAEAYNDTISKLEKAIGEIIGFDIKFVLDDNLRYVNVKYHDQLHDFEVLPDGLKSIISWLADLCMRLEGLDWKDDIPVLNRNIILFLDEIENHLHIKWQRKVLPVIQKLLPNAQIFVSTHSPFIVNSVDDAWVYKLENNEKTKLTTVSKAQPTKTGNSYIFELMRVFGIEEEFGEATQQKLNTFYQLMDKIKSGEAINKEEFINLAEELANESIALNNEVNIELRKLNRQTDNAFSL